MEIELLEKKEQPLLARIEVSFRITHPKEPTPKRDAVREGLAEQMKVKKSCVIVDNMKADFGKSETIGFAKIYKTDKEAKAIERKHILIRNKLEMEESNKSEDKEKKK